MVSILTPAEILTQDNAQAVASPAAETIILTSTAVSAGGPGSSTKPVRIGVTINITAGTGATAVVVRCRQGSLVTGTLVNAALTITLAAGNSAQFHLVFRDTSGYLTQAGGGQYTVTVAETGATANGTVNDIDIEVRQ